MSSKYSLQMYKDVHVFSNKYEDVHALSSKQKCVHYVYEVSSKLGKLSWLGKFCLLEHSFSSNKQCF